MKLYEVIFQDEWNNLSLVGWYKDLNDAVEDVNKYLDVYGDGNYKIESLIEYPSTFGGAFDVELAQHFSNDEDETAYDVFQSAMIRGFVHEFSEKDAMAIYTIMNS